MSTAKERLLKLKMQEAELLTKQLQTLRHAKLKTLKLNEAQREFLNKSGTYRELMMSGGNQLGKSEVLRYLISMHLTGDYPDWYTGVRWDKPFMCAIGGKTGRTTRDVLTDQILGRWGERGTGMLPMSIVDEDDIVYKTGGCFKEIDYFEVKHRSGYKNRAICFSYAQPVGNIMGYTIDWIACDEEPPGDFYSELRARLLHTMGHIFISMTPLDGVFEVYTQFENDEKRWLQHYTIDNAAHLTPAQVEFRHNEYPPGHPERDARLYGRPIRGTGLFFFMPDADIVVEPFKIPDHWKVLIGIDFPHTVSGYFAAVKVAYDTESDTVYVISEYKQNNQNRAVYAERVRAMGGDRIPVAWPQDGNRLMDDGRTEATYYKDLGLRLMTKAAHRQTLDGKRVNATMPVISEMVDRFVDGRLKIFSTCPVWLDEKKKFTHKNGKVQRKFDNDDHLIDATVKAVMMLRYSEEGDTIKESRQEALFDMMSHDGDDFFTSF